MVPRNLHLANKIFTFKTKITNKIFLGCLRLGNKPWGSLVVPKICHLMGDE